MAAEKKKKYGVFLKWMLFGLLAVLLCLFENTWYALGTGSVLLLLPCLAACVGFYEGRAGGAYFGIFCGLLSDAAGGASVWLSPVLLALFGYLGGRGGERFLRRGFFTFSAVCFAAQGAYGVYRLSAALIYTRFDTAVILFGIPRGARDALVSFLCGLLLYLPVRLLSLLGRDTARRVPTRRARLVGGRR